MRSAATLAKLCAELLSSGQRVRFRVRGASMYPAIRDGEGVTVAPVGSHEIRRGDVLLYETERGLTAHRVVGRPGRAPFLRVRADAPGSDDEQVRFDQVLGRIESVERGGRFVPVSGRLTRQAHRIARLVKRLASRAR